MEFNQALQMLGQSLEAHAKPNIQACDVPVVSAAFCVLYQKLIQVSSDRAQLLDELCTFGQEPQCWVRVHYNHDVLWRGAKEIRISEEKRLAVKAFELQETEPWLSIEDAYSKIKGSL